MPKASRCLFAGKVRFSSLTSRFLSDPVGRDEGRTWPFVMRSSRKQKGEYSVCDKVKQITDTIIRFEGAYSNNPADKGGETMYGITVSVARANGYSGPMANMPRAVAERIYRDRYVVAPRFDKVLALSEASGVDMIDTGVKMGRSRAGA